MFWAALFTLAYAQSATLALKEIATVEVIKRSERSAAADYDYDVLVSAFDATHRLKLRSADPILSPDFKYHEIDLDEHGQTVFTDLTPSIRSLRDIQGNIYIDQEKDAAVRIRNVDGNFEMEGLVNGARISRQDGEHVAELSKSPKKNRTDYIDLHRSMPTPRGLLMDKLLTATPEIAAVFDYQNSKLFNFDQKLIIEYLTILFNSVNNRYSLNEDPKIICTLVGVHIIKTKEAQPFVEESINPGGRDHSLEKILKAYMNWAFQNKNQIPKHDIAPLIVGVEFDGDAIGLAPLGGACLFDMNGETNAATPVSQDVGGFFKGAYVVAHELAHNMGAPHDGDAEHKASDCPWSEGYLMSYEGWGTINKFGLSKCSQHLIKEFAASGGACLLLKLHTGNKALPESSDQIGDKVSMKMFCEKVTNNPEAMVFFQDGDDSCRQIKCKIQVGQGVQIMTTGHPAGNNAPCGEGGKCLNGNCVGQKTVGGLTMDQLCVKITGKENSRVHFEDPNAQCGPDGFKCTVPMGGGMMIMGSGMQAKEGTICGDGGKCKNSKCVGAKPMDYATACQKMTGVPEARAADGAMCDKLSCRTDTSLMTIPSNVPNGVLCGKAGGACQNGKCSA